MERVETVATTAKTQTVVDDDKTMRGQGSEACGRTEDWKCGNHSQGEQNPRGTSAPTYCKCGANCTCGNACSCQSTEKTACPRGCKCGECCKCAPVNCAYGTFIS